MSPLIVLGRMRRLDLRGEGAPGGGSLLTRELGERGVRPPELGALEESGAQEGDVVGQLQEADALQTREDDRGLLAEMGPRFHGREAPRPGEAV